MLSLDSAIVAVSMDTANNEGLVGTSKGSIYYINFEERVNIRLTVSPPQKEEFKLEMAQNVLMAYEKKFVNFYSPSTLDLVLQIKKDSAISFVKKFDHLVTIIGHENGIISFYDM